jgi:hypothetical protein
LKRKERENRKIEKNRKKKRRKREKNNKEDNTIQHNRKAPAKINELFFFHHPHF